MMSLFEILAITPPKFNMEPENDSFQKNPFPAADSHVNH